MKPQTSFWLTTLLLVLLSLSSFAQMPNRPVPPGFYPYTFVQLDSSDFGHYSFASFSPFTFGSTAQVDVSKPFILDPNGYLLWYRQDSSLRFSRDFKYNSVANQYQLTEIRGPGQIGFSILNDSLRKINTLEAVAPWGPDNHDFQIHSDGSYLISTVTDSTFDLSGYTFSGNAGMVNTVCVCNGIQKVDAANNLLWEWNSCDHIHPSEFVDGFPYDPTAFDFVHINAIEEDSDGHYLVSMRHTDAIYKVHSQTGNLIWTLGGKSSSFTFPNDDGFSGQHDIRRLPNGDISLFDNGNSKPTPIESRAVHFALDTNNWTATRTWEHVPNPSFYARAMGSYQYGTAASLINYGFVYRPQPSADLIDANGQVLTRIFLKDTLFSYRGTLFQPQTPIPRPPVSCAEVGSMVELQGPPGYDKYLWSTGDTSTNVLVPFGATYQLWVPFGDGMAGSLPVFVSQTGGCSLVGAPGPVVGGGRPPKLLQVFDLLGRAVEQPVPNQVYIEVYSDGSVRKRVWVQ